MKKIDRKEIKEHISTYYDEHEYFCGYDNFKYSFSEMEKTFKQAREDYKDKYHDFELEITIDHGYYGDSASLDIALEGVRWETDKEFEKRKNKIERARVRVEEKKLKDEKNAKKMREKKKEKEKEDERQLLKKLHKKYGNKKLGEIEIT